MFFVLLGFTIIHLVSILHGQSLNDICKTDDWSIIKGTWLYNESDGCSLFNTDSGDGNIVWFGNNTGTIYNTNYNSSSFILEVNISFPSAIGGNAGIFFRTQYVTTTNETSINYYFGLTSSTVFYGKFNGTWNEIDSSLMTIYDFILMIH